MICEIKIFSHSYIFFNCSQLVWALGPRNGSIPSFFFLFGLMAYQHSWVVNATAIFYKKTVVVFVSP